jgi:hypothetical protein
MRKKWRKCNGAQPYGSSANINTAAINNQLALA